MKAGLSIVVPLYNEAKNLARLHAQLSEVARKLAEARDLSVEFVYVDDGSSDNTLQIARALPAASLDVQVLALSRNFGKEAALAAGLDHAARGAVLFMDGDGQHPPALIETLVSHWLDGGYDVVYTAKAHRENEFSPAPARQQDILRNAQLGGAPQDPEDAGDFRLLSPRAALALRQMPERNRFFKGLASWIGFKQIRVDYRPDERQHGTTTFGWASLIGLSIEGMTSFSVAPLRLASLLGALMAASALVFGASMLFEVLFYGVAVPGYPSVVVGLMVLGGVQLVMIGVLGEYIGKILSEQKARPIYFIAEHSVKAAEDAAGATRTAAE